MAVNCNRPDNGPSATSIPTRPGRRQTVVAPVAPPVPNSAPHGRHRPRKDPQQVLHVSRSDHVCATDITYIPMRAGFVYLVAIMDWFSRRVLSWRLSNTIDSTFCVDALEEALERVGSPAWTHSSRPSSGSDRLCGRTRAGRDRLRGRTRAGPRAGRDRLRSSTRSKERGSRRTRSRRCFASVASRSAWTARDGASTTSS
jgi:putative transposase